jgi:hypothetical protein
MPNTANEVSFWRRVKVSFYATLVFYLLTNPLTQRLFATVFSGLPFGIHYLLTGIVFGFCLLGLLMFPSDL